MSIYEDEYNTYDSNPDVKEIDFIKLKINDYMIVGGRSCRIFSIKNAKIGKYGRDEILVTGIDLFTHEKCQSTVPKLSKVEIPVVKISVFQLISIDNDKFCTLIDILGNTKADLKLPETYNHDKEMSNNIINNFHQGKEVLVTTLYSLGFEKIVDFKTI